MGNELIAKTLTPHFKKLGVVETALEKSIELCESEGLVRETVDKATGDTKLVYYNRSEGNEIQFVKGFLKQYHRQVFDNAGSENRPSASQMMRMSSEGDKQ